MKDRDGHTIAAPPPVWLTSVSAGCFGGLIALVIAFTLFYFAVTRVWFSGH